MTHLAQFDQDSFRFRYDDESEADALWLAAANTNVTLPVGATFRVRFLIQEANGVDPGSNPQVWQLQYNLASGGWNNVTGASSVVQAVASPWITDGVATTEQMAGAQTFRAGQIDEANGACQTAGFVADEETEVEFVCQIVASGVTDGQTLQLRVIDGSQAQDFTVDGGTYTNTPTVTVEETLSSGITALSGVSMAQEGSFQPPYVVGGAKYGIFVSADGYYVCAVKTTSATPADGDWAGVGTCWGVVGGVKAIATYLHNSDIYVAAVGGDGQPLFGILDPGTDAWTASGEVPAQNLTATPTAVPTVFWASVSVKSDGIARVIYPIFDGSNHRGQIVERSSGGTWSLPSTDQTTSEGIFLSPPDASNNLGTLEKTVTGVAVRRFTSAGAFSGAASVDFTRDTANHVVSNVVINGSDVCYGAYIDADDKISVANWELDGTLNEAVNTGISDNTVKGNGATSPPYMVACMFDNNGTPGLIYADASTSDIFVDTDVSGTGGTDAEAVDAVTCNRISAYVNTTGTLEFFYDNANTTTYGTYDLGGGGATTINGGTGTYTLSGQAASTYRGLRQVAGQGTYTLTGQAIITAQGFNSQIETGTYSLSGQSVSTLWDHYETAVQGTYTLNGQAASLYQGSYHLAEQGTYTLTGQAVTTTPAFALLAAQGVYTLNGQPASLYQGSYHLAEQGTYTLNGQDILTAQGFNSQVATGLYALTGQNVQTYRGLYHLAEQGTYNLTGQPVTTTVAGGNETIDAGRGNYTITGQAVDTLWNHYENAVQGVYTLNGQDVSTYQGFLTTAGQGTYNLTGQDVSTLWGHYLTAIQGNYTLTGQPATISEGGGGGGSFQALAIENERGTDWLSRASDFTGNVDSKQCTGAFLFKTSELQGQLIWFAGVSGFFNVTVGSTLNIQGKNTSGTTILNAVKTSSGYDDGEWHLAMFSFDLADTAKRHFLVDGTEVSPTYSTYTNDNIDFTQASHGIFGTPGSGGSGLDGCAAELWFDPGTYIDFSVSSNVQKVWFNNAPVNLGDNGERLTGSSPLIFLSKRGSDTASDFATNKGTGGDLTENGALADCADNPPAGFNFYTMIANQGTYTLTGQPATTYPNTLRAVQGTYTISGQDISSLWNHYETAVQGSYSLNGQPAQTYKGYAITAGQGSYTLDGQAASFQWDHNLFAVQGAYTLNGQPAGTFYVIATTVAEQGVYTLAGQDAITAQGYYTALETGYYTFDGQPALLIVRPHITDTTDLQLPIDYQYFGHPQPYDGPIGFRSLGRAQISRRLGKMVK